MDLVAYQFANLCCLSALAFGLGLIAGFGWGRETEQQAQADAIQQAEAARVQRFRVIFQDGVKQKNAAPKGRQYISQR